MTSQQGASLLDLHQQTLDHRLRQRLLQDRLRRLSPSRQSFPPLAEMSPMRQQVGHQAHYQVTIDSQPRSLSEAIQAETTLGGLEEPLDAPAPLAPTHDVLGAQRLRREHEAPLPGLVAFEPI